MLLIDPLIFSLSKSLAQGTPPSQPKVMGSRVGKKEGQYMAVDVCEAALGEAEGARGGRGREAGSNSEVAGTGVTEHR